MYSTRSFASPEPSLDRAFTRSIPIGGEARCVDGVAGRITRVVRDTTGALTHLVVHRTGYFARRVLVAGKHALHFGDDHVTLNLRRAELDGFPEHRPDDDILADVDQALRSMELFHDRDDFVAVRVGVANGVVELRGYVRSEARRAESALIARRIRGVLEVRNHLFSDESISLTIGRVLAADSRLAGKRIRSSCRLGVVDLFGEVETRAERAAATVTARQVPGVTAVNSLLRVTG